MNEKYNKKYYLLRYTQLVKNKNILLDWQKKMLQFFEESPFSTNKNIKILEFGCGLANFLYVLRRKKYRKTIGLDISRFALKQIKERYKLILICRSDCNIPIKSKSIDVCFVSHVFEHLGKTEFSFLLDEINRIMKPDGLLISSHPVHSLVSTLLIFPYLINLEGDWTHKQKLFAHSLLINIRRKFDLIKYSYDHDALGSNIITYQLSKIFSILGIDDIHNPLFYGNIIISAKPQKKETD
jgi:SAM-dependent methyltransferase